jgi:hypothetical protein
MFSWKLLLLQIEPLSIRIQWCIYQHQYMQSLLSFTLYQNYTNIKKHFYYKIFTNQT